MLNIPAALRKKLDEKCFIANVEIAKKLVSAIDGTVKYLYRLYDGEYIESVLMKYEHGYTVCVSTQVGCRMGCKFCASGLNGLTRNLLAAVVIFMAFSSMTCIIWILIESPDLAITEAAVGAGISGTLFLMTLKKLHAEDTGETQADLPGTPGTPDSEDAHEP